MISAAEETERRLKDELRQAKSASAEAEARALSGEATEGLEPNSLALLDSR